MKTDGPQTAPTIELPSREPLPVQPGRSSQPGARLARPAQLLLGSLWFGLLAGYGEIGLRAFGFFVLGRRNYLGPDAIWMAPLADVCIFAVLGLLLALAAYVWRGAGHLKLVGFIWAFAAVIGAIESYPRLHNYAAIALAAGIAVTAARTIAAKSDRFWLMARKSTLPMGVGIALIAGAVLGSRALEERSALQSLPAAPEGAPNVLLIVLDTVRAQNLSLYGHSKPTTPELERLASRGVVFERAISTAPWTLPSHGSMFTGRYAHELSANWQTPLDDSHRTLAEALRDRGYVTAGFVANLIYCTRFHGLDRGFAHYEDYPITLGRAAKSSWLAWTITRLLERDPSERQQIVKKSAQDINTASLSWLAEQRSRPWFMFLNYMDAHAPYRPPEPFLTRFKSHAVVRRDERRALSANPAKWPKAKFQKLEGSYDGSIAYMDHYLGLLFDELERRGALANTLVVVTSDHGEQFGEHGLIDHSNSLYRPLLHVPLVFAFPGKLPEGRRVSEPVTLRDLPRTVLDVVGAGKGPAFPGRSLASYWDKTSPGDEKPSPLLSSVRQGIRIDPWLPASKGDMQSIVDLGLHYIVGGDGSQELYDFDRDIAEKHNLSGSAPRRGTIERLKKRLPKP